MPSESPSISPWEKLRFLERPGILFGLCLWAHSLLVYMLVLHDAAAADRADHAAGRPPSEDILRARLHWHKKDLKDVICEFRALYGDKLTPAEKRTLETLQSARNLLAHCFFSLSYLDRAEPFVCYIPRQQKEEETVTMLTLDDAALLALESDLKPLTIWCQEFAGTEWGINLQTLP